jgi:hypothetical protein
MSAPDRFTLGQTVHVRHVSGLYFHEETPADVARLIAHYQGTGERIRFFYGDRATGKSWADEFDIIGTIGRSMGPCVSPLLIRTSRSYGGGAILTHCIVAIRECTSRQWTYRAPGFNPGTWATIPADVPGYCETVTHDGNVHARFKKPGAAARYCEFMRGERFAK